MRRSSVVGQCRHAARLSSARSRPSTSFAAIAPRYTSAYHNVRSFSSSSHLTFQKESNSGPVSLKSDVSLDGLFDPSEASRKLFSDFAFAFE